MIKSKNKEIIINQIIIFFVFNMLSKKRVKDDEVTQPDESVTQYQNRCLVSRLKVACEELSLYKNKYDSLITNNSSLYKIFMEINCRLLNLSDSLNIIFSCDNSSYGLVNLGVKLLSSLKEDFKFKEISEEYLSMIDNIKNNIESIFGSIISNTKSNHIISNDIENKISLVHSDLIKIKEDNSILSAELIDIKAKLAEKDALINKLSDENKALNLRIIANPVVPLIKYLEYFKVAESSENKIPHTCYCYVCAKDFDQKTETLKSDIENLVNEKNKLIEQLSLISSNNNHYQQSNVIIVNNQVESKSNKEYEDLKQKMEKVINENIDLKNALKLNENYILGSDAFKSIITQNESNIVLYDEMKNNLNSLNTKYQNLLNETYQLRYNDQKRDKVLLEENNSLINQLNEEISKNNKEISSLKQTINQIKNQKESNINFDSIYDQFNKESQRQTSELNTFKQLLAQYRAKADKLNEENFSLTKEAEIIKSKLEAFTDQTIFEINKAKDKEKSLRIAHLENLLKEKNEELEGEKAVIDNLIQEITETETSINNFSKEIKVIREQLKNEIEKVTTLTQEKIKEQILTESLIKERELYKSIITQFEVTKLRYDEYLLAAEEEKSKRESYIATLKNELFLKEEIINEQTTANSNLLIDLNESKSICDQQCKIIQKLKEEIGKSASAVSNNTEVKNETTDNRELNYLIQENDKLKVS